MNKPPLVLHICCAPDEAWVVKTLKEQYTLYSFFCNPNIYPANEFDVRLAEAQKVAAKFDVPFFYDPYDPDSWENAIKNYSSTPEGGERCRECFLLRLERTAIFCKKMDLPTFTTVMSVSPHKRITMLNETGLLAASRHDVSYLCFDFKKKNGFLQSIILSKELGLYRQDYCGCRLSIAERDLRKQRQQQKLQQLNGQCAQ